MHRISDHPVYRCTIPKKLIKDNPIERNIIFWLNKKNQIVISPLSRGFERVNGIFIPSHFHSNGHSFSIILPRRVMDSFIHQNNLKSAYPAQGIANKDSFKIIANNGDFVLF